MIKKITKMEEKWEKRQKIECFITMAMGVTMIMAISVKCDKDKATSNDPNNDDLKKIS